MIQSLWLKLKWVHLIGNYPKIVWIIPFCADDLDFRDSIPETHMYL